MSAGDGKVRHRARKQSSFEPSSRDADSPGLAARMVAARLLAAVVERQVPLDGLTDETGGQSRYLALESRDRLLVRAIVNSALRFRGTIEALISARLNRDLPRGATTLSHILHVGAAQILFLDVPDSAAVNLAVSHAGADARTRRFTSLVNAVLRAIAREKDNALPAALASATDAPKWFAARLRHVYGTERAAHILAAHRREPAFDLTVMDDPDDWAQRLDGVVMPTGMVRLERGSGPVSELAGYEQGAWWVQDAAAALPARLMGGIEGRRIADLCAAPGGKTAQLCLAGARVTAVEKSPRRTERLRANLDRLGLEAEIVATDLFDFEPDVEFDAVLLDAPCSSTGTVRRHPDVPWTKSEEDIARLAKLQERMLERALGLVRPGGIVVFSNCSLDPAEGEELVSHFLAHNGDAELVPIETGEIAGAEEFVAPQGWLRTTPEAWPSEIPEMGGLDGFFAARLRRFS